MNKKTRDRFFGTFVVLFIVITTVLSLMATGYRFNLSWPLNFGHLLQKTGTIALDSDPSGAKINISGEQKKGISLLSVFNNNKELVTPIKIKDLLPGEYNVSFEMPGYWPYEKKVRVNATQTTFLENIILFKKSLALNIASTSAQEIIYSVNNRYAWLTKDKNIIDLKTEQVVYRNLAEKISWTKEEKHIIDSSKLVNLENSSVTDYQNTINAIQELQIHDNEIIYLNKNNLTIYNLSDKSSRAISSDGEILSYKSLDKEVLVIIKKDKDIRLESYSLDNTQINSSVDLLLEAKNYSISQEDDGSVILNDKDHNILYIINIKNKLSVLSTLRGINTYKWKGDGRFIYASGSDIYIYDIKQDKSWLINRLSESVNSLAWSNNDYLIYATDKNIGIINLSEGRNDVTVIGSADKISSLALDDKNQILYFYASINQQDGLYKISLR